MITNINKLVDPFRESFKNLFTHIETPGHLAGKAVKYLADLPIHMQQNQSVAVTVFIVSNAIFFTLTHFFAQFLNNCIDRCTTYSPDHRAFTKNFVVNGVLVGGAVCCLNYSLAKTTQFALKDQRLSAFLLTGMTISDCRALFFKFKTGN